MNFKRLLWRVRFYYTLGYSIISLPIVFLGFSRTLYSFVDNLPILNILFPNFRQFLILGGILLILFAILTGVVWVKSPFYKAGFEIPAEKNPYAYRLAPGRDITLYFGQLIGQKCMLRIFKELKAITPDEEVQYMRYIQFMEQLNKGGDIREVHL